MSFKINDIRPEGLMEAKKAFLEEDKEFLRSRKTQFVRVKCPACKSSERDVWGEKEGFIYDICHNCNTVYMNPRAPEELMNKFYRQSKNYEFWNRYIFPASEKIRKEKIFKPRAKKVVDYCKKNNLKGSSLLEIGSGFGTFCESIKEYNFFKEIIAVEPTPHLAETCRKRGFKVYELPVEQLELSKESIEVIVNFEVIEHLFNPDLFIEYCIKYLKINGLFICTCPNIESLGPLVLREKAKVIDHEHINYFNPASLSYLLEKKGLEILEVSTPGELELLKEALQEDLTLQKYNPFFTYLIFSSNNNIFDDFQNFLKRNNLSSHMWILARKR